MLCVMAYLENTFGLCDSQRRAISMIDLFLWIDINGLQIFVKLYFNAIFAGMC